MEFRVAQADPGTFEVLATEPEYYAKDKARVYYGAEEIKGCDPASFQILQSSGMSRDKSHLFQGVRWVSADPDHFELLDAAWARDQKHAYYVFEVVKGVDPKALQVFPERYAYDGKTLFSFGKALPLNPRPTKVEVLKSPDGAFSDFWTDGQSVFFEEKRLLSQAEMGKVKVLNRSFLRYGDSFWYGPDKLEGVDAQTFEISTSEQGLEVGRDRSAVYGVGSYAPGSK